MPDKQYQRTIQSDNLDEVVPMLQAILHNANLHILQTEDGNPRDFVIQEITNLKEETMESGFFEITLALNRILKSFNNSEELGNIEYMLLNPDEDNSWKCIQNTLDATIADFDNLFNSSKATYYSVKDELVEIYEYDENSKLDINLYMLDIALLKKNSTYFGLILSDQNSTKNHLQLSDDDLIGLFISVIGEDDLDAFQILYENPHTHKTYNSNLDEIVFRCMIDDAPSILQNIIFKNSHIYEIYNPEKIIQIIEESGSLHGLRKIFNNQEIEFIEERYKLSEFLKDTSEGLSKAVTCHNIEKIKARILETEKLDKESNGINYKEFQIRKNLLDVNDLAIMAAKQDAPEVLNFLISHSEYDDSKASPEDLASWASWDNAPSSLEVILNRWDEPYNQEYADQSPFILSFAKIAIREHATDALSVILKHIKLDLKETNFEDRPAISSLVFEALDFNSENCLNLLLKKTDEIFANDKNSRTYKDIKYEVEERLQNDSGAEALSTPPSPTTYMHYGDMGSSASSGCASLPTSPTCNTDNFEKIIGDGAGSLEAWLLS